jgi:rhamnose transport system ATP-binding protein
VGTLSLISANAIYKSFAGVQALKSASLDLQPGEVHALVGENGAGKTTLIKVITGAVRADAGTLEINGVAVSDNNPLRARSLGVAAIYQQPALFPDLTVAENIALETEPTGLWRRVNWRRRYDRARALLEQIGAHIDTRALVNELSMPQQQLVEIARALGTDARVLILDEPTASLTSQEVEKLFTVIRQLRASGTGIIYISHRLDEIFQLADRITVLRDGMSFATRLASEVDHDSLIRMMVGKDLANTAGNSSQPPGETLLEARDLSCRAAGLRDITLRVRAGEILGLAGLVGSGRTDLAAALFGLQPFDTGEVLLHGNSLKIRNPGEAIQSGIALVPEDRRRHGIIASMTVSENMTLAALGDISKRGLIDHAAEEKAAASLTRALGVKTPSIHNAAGNLSGGNQQKVALARALATDPALLILDEPTQGVDVGAKSEIHRLIRQLADRGTAIIMISSDWPELLAMSDRIAVMREGTIAGEIDRGKATQEKLLKLAFGHPEGATN